MPNYKQIFAIQKANKEKLLKVCPTLTDESGIYILTREENGFKYAYIGQAVKLLSRLCSHLSGYQHIDLSLRKHGLYSKENPTGWEISHLSYSTSELDEMEQYFIKQYANDGYQMRNKTAGSQGKGKEQIAEYKPSKGYRQGLEQGYKNAQREVKHLFDLHLCYSTKSNIPSKNQAKALAKFKDFLGE